jgi:hypothetical protein
MRLPVGNVRKQLHPYQKLKQSLLKKKATAQRG